MAGIEGRGRVGELSVQGMHERRLEPVGHGKRRKAAVIVNHIEALVATGKIDLLECPRDVIGLVQ